MFGVITTRRHNEIVAPLHTKAKADDQLIAKLFRENLALTARLAVFTAPRARDGAGRFLKGEGK